MEGIFRCRRKIGDDVLTAWEYTLRAHVSCVAKIAG